MQIHRKGKVSHNSNGSTLAAITEFAFVHLDAAAESQKPVLEPRAVNVNEPGSGRALRLLKLRPVLMAAQCSRQAECLRAVGSVWVLAFHQYPEGNFLQL